MKRLLLLLPLLMLFAISLSYAQEIVVEDEIEFADMLSMNSYGQPLDSTVGTLHMAAEAVKDESLHNKVVNVQGVILDVCQKKGCWMVLGTPDTESDFSLENTQMRITFKDYSFFVPTDCSGKFAMVQGVVSVEEIPEDVAKHYAEESKGEDPDAISGPQRVVTMVATNVRILE